MLVAELLFVLTSNFAIMPLWPWNPNTMLLRPDRIAVFQAASEPDVPHDLRALCLTQAP